jgi:hyaluronan synthase
MTGSSWEATPHAGTIAYRRLWWVLLAASGVFIGELLWFRLGLAMVPSLRMEIDGLGLNLWPLTLILGATATLMLAWRSFLAARYRPLAAVCDEQLPYLTVVVPAYNEGHQVLATLRSLLASDYPSEKLFIIAVDDGSGDDTWDWIKRAAAEAPGSVLTVRRRRNGGKRTALNEGFRRARGSVLVTVDSDSEVDANTLRNLVTPFVLDSRVGAVAGNVRVLNRCAGAIPRMLEVVFTYSFDFIRAGQSELRAVVCTPGALSAYRRDVVLTVVDRWLAQRFMGRPANIGEDRALTNLILSEGFDVTFQGTAVVRTVVPIGVGSLCRMLLRWARSNVRESLVMASFLFRRFRPNCVLGVRINFVYESLRLLVRGALWCPVLMLTALHPLPMTAALAAGLIAGALPSALVYALLRSARGSLWAFGYAVYAFVSLSWITPYALLTPHQNGWLTRGLAGNVDTTMDDVAAPLSLRRRANSEG